MSRLESWQQRSRKYGYGQVDRLNREMEMAQPQRGPRAHEPVEMKELLVWGPMRAWRCHVCNRVEDRYMIDLPAGFIGITCHGDAVMEGVEG